ncbi:MAG: helix-turn-helix domain-containing protein [Muribaculaceae bacterium]|nr:helix-turn-helix domain-containing protein [Muribaculaceae bacterium]
MKTINIDILVSDYTGGCRFSKDLYVYPGKGEDTDEGMMRLDTLGFCIVEKGRYEICLNNKVFVLGCQDILIANPNDFYENVKFSSDFDGLLIFASIDLLDGLVEPTHLHHCLNVLKETPVHKISTDLWSLIKSYCAILTVKTALNTLSKSDETAEMIGKAFLADIFNLVLKDVELIPSDKSETRPQALYRRFINLLVSTPMKSHEVAYYADKLSISPRYLAALCKTVSGKSAREWIVEYVMNDVRRYLIGTDLSVKEVASRTLFMNFSFFSKTVKRYFGMTPLELRNSR